MLNELFNIYSGAVTIVSCFKFKEVFFFLDLRSLSDLQREFFCDIEYILGTFQYLWSYFEDFQLNFERIFKLKCHRITTVSETWMIFWKFVKSVVRIQRKNRRLNRDLVRSNHYLHNTQFPLKRQILAPQKIVVYTNRHRNINFR